MTSLNLNGGQPINAPNMSQDLGQIKSTGFSIPPPSSQGAGNASRRRYANVVSETRNVEPESATSGKHAINNVYSSGKQSQLLTGDKKVQSSRPRNQSDAPAPLSHHPQKIITSSSSSYQAANAGGNPSSGAGLKSSSQHKSETVTPLGSHTTAPG